ncbi:NCS1 nucleoside transporter family [Rhodotorula sp. JG-1b]|nr:NCS1 nucleoside transporter family [Rhodotorula sp. JG-1b]
MSSLKRLARAIELRQPNGRPASFWANRDLLPVPPKERKWTAINYFTFWIADSFNVNTFMIASSGIALGMTWWQCWLAVWIGYSISGLFLAANAYAGAEYHIIFPAYIRASFGPILGIWCTMNRGVMACVWYGTQAWLGGQAFYTLILSIWPSFRHLHNGIPASGTDTAHFLCFFLFSLISLVAIWFPIHQIRHLFTLKAYAAPAAGIALFAICIGKAHGAGDLIHAKATVGGSTLGWAFVGSATGSIANMATLITNSVDFASRASKPSDVVLPQIISLPVCFAVTSLFGILIGSASEKIFGEFVWNPLDVMERLLETYNTHGMRAGIAFISIGFIIAQIGTNIAANSLSAGCDLTSIMPRYLNIRRGGYIAALVGFCICPWNFLKSSSNFTTYLSAYSVFLSSICGVMMSHYFFVVKRRIKVADLYHFNDDGIYKYWHGINLRALAAYLAGILINVVGFAGAVGADVSLAAQRIYTLSFLTGWPTAALTYYILCRIWPLPIPTDEEILEVPAALSGANKVVVSAPSDGSGHHHAGGADVLSLGEGDDEKDEKLDDHDSDRARGMVEIV